MEDFHRRFVELFEAHHPKLVRVLVRLSGEPELAADLVQEAFVKLYRRGALPDSPEAWLVTVALNRLRNERNTRTRRQRLMAPVAAAAAESIAESSPSVTEASACAEKRRRVRTALERLPERERRLLVLRAEGYAYRDIAAALDVQETSVGTLLARARRAFLGAYGEGCDAPR